MDVTPRPMHDANLATWLWAGRRPPRWLRKASLAAPPPASPGQTWDQIVLHLGSGGGPDVLVSTRRVLPAANARRNGKRRPMTVVDDLEPRLANGIIKYVGNTGDIEAQARCRLLSGWVP